MREKNFFIGIGGWTYFQVAEPVMLATYSKRYNFVEVNSTYSEIPPISKVKLWRKAVPEGFRFSVMAHYSMAHNIVSGSIRKAHELLGQMVEVCLALCADVLVLQFPTSSELNEGSIPRVRGFIENARLDYVRLAFEIRNDAGEKLPRGLIEAMQDNQVIHCVDLLRGELPAYGGEALYSRLCGLTDSNLYQPTDDELAQISSLSCSYKTVYFAFHGSKKSIDAARIETYHKTGEFPMVTGALGLESLEAIVMEDTRFPVTKDELLEQHGWKLFDLSREKRVRAQGFLERLPNKTYNSLSEIREGLNASYSES